MSALQISQDLQKWLDSCKAAGHSRDSVRASLRAHGYDRHMAERICTHAFGPVQAEKSVLAQSEAFAFPSGSREYAHYFEPAWPLQGAYQRNQIAADHGMIRILGRSERPYAISLGNMLTAEECAELIELARPRLVRAQVVGDEENESVIDPRRTAEEAVLELGETPLVARIDARIQALTNLPVSHGEGLQVMRYREGAEYQPHYDFFDGSRPGSAKRLRDGQRVATLVMYLNDVAVGGETIFPEAGLEVVPHQGNAVYFAYIDALGRCDNMSFHGGAPVGAGEKWIATKWLRERPFYR